MRELKFRAWDKQRNRYVGDGEVVFKSYGSEASVVVCPNSQDYIGDICHDEYVDDGRFVIEQYTGVKDKNGKEIYEGDILWWEHYYGMTGENIETTAKVYWEEKDASFVVGDWFEPLGPLVVEDKVEVIGNVHENPELIEEKSNGK